MATRKPHLNVNNYFTPEVFRSRGSARGSEVPLRNTAVHGKMLSDQFLQILNTYEQRAPDEDAITEEKGIYVEIISFEDSELPLDSLDTSRDFKLRAVKKTDDGRHIAIVFIPELRRKTFQNKVEQYINFKNKKGDKPKNHKLIGSISEVRLANIRSFWTDSASDFPQDSNQAVWWELWLKGRLEENTKQVAKLLSLRIDAVLGNTAQHFFDSSVFLIKASVNQLESATSLIGNLEELRKAKETPNVLLHSAPKEQQEWVDSLVERLEIPEVYTSSVCIMDSGVNYHHPLLCYGILPDMAECWNPNWPHFDTYSFHAPYHDHGSLQAGLALFGNLQEALVSTGSIRLSHCIESARILPPISSNDPELYGAITVGTAAKIEASNPNLPRVYSLAVTASPEDLGGQPSSWSAEIDLYTSGMFDGYRRLFVISTGNIRNLGVYPDFWDQIHLSEIEDPAQSWNAITVGAYTELTTNDDPTFSGWAPIARAGDASPATRSAVNWGWIKQAPYKPDVVAEGGNRLISPDQTEVSNAESVSLLTTSGKTSGDLFEVNTDTSAATALVSRQAAILMSEYPAYWPETIRGLIVHAAEWTPRMWERYGSLQRLHSHKVAKETMLRTVGHGVTSLDRARYSADHALTLIAENTITPFTKATTASASTDPNLNEMQLYQLPWPIEALQSLPPELEVKLKITLSYFIEPSPGRRGYKQRYSYQSHGLRFEVIRPGQSLPNFRAFVNGLANIENYHGPEGDSDGWHLGPHLRKRGSLHTDTWTGDAQSLADMYTIAVYPVGGWWKYRTAEDRWTNDVRYSLLVSVEVPNQDVDIYSIIETMVETEIQIPIEV
uniref:S8 family peptidase n=1 Tax=Marinobacterium profundum TaxID=1714300 RepID=UPI0009EA2A49|nr:S8 family peptidase [Marinobacterium profundum]